MRNLLQSRDKMICKHIWEPKQSRGATHPTQREQCVKCGTWFPCRHACGHYDCAEARGEPSPFDLYRTNNVAEATCSDAHADLVSSAKMMNSSHARHVQAIDTLEEAGLVPQESELSSEESEQEVSHASD